MAVYTDYTHLTAMVAPNPLLIGNDVRNNCCFRADYAQALQGIMACFCAKRGKKKAPSAGEGNRSLPLRPHDRFSMASMIWAQSPRSVDPGVSDSVTKPSPSGGRSS